MTQRAQEILIGILVFSGLLLLAVLIALFGEFRELFERTYQVEVTFPTASGVRKGTPVFITGVEVGSVEELALTHPGVKLTVAIGESFDIPQGSTVTIGQKGILADAYIEFSGGDPNLPPLPHDGSARLQGSVSPSIGDAAARLQGLAESLDAFFGDETLQQDVRQAMANISAFAARGPEFVDDSHAMVQEVRRFVDLTATLTQDAQDLSRDLGNQLNHQGENLDRLTRSLVESSVELNRALRNVGEMLTELKRGQGSIGRALSDDELYRDLLEAADQAKAAMAELRETVAYYREHPPEVKFSLFGSQ